MEKEIEFMRNWIAVLDTMYPGDRGKVNAVSISLTGKFLAIDQSGRVTVEEVERTDSSYRPNALNASEVKE